MQVKAAVENKRSWAYMFSSFEWDQYIYTKYSEHYSG